MLLLFVIWSEATESTIQQTLLVVLVRAERKLPFYATTDVEPEDGKVEDGSWDRIN